MTERKPHKWVEVIKAWADGKTIQFKGNGFSDWVDYDPDALRNSQASAHFFPFDIPRFDLDFEWRVKPENIVFEECFSPVKWVIQNKEEYKLGRFDGSIKGEPNLRLEFDPDTKELIKAEVIG